MEARATNWIWFHGRLHGPYFLWEVFLIHSKFRAFLIYDAKQGWVGYRAWDRSPIADSLVRPEVPSRLSRAGLRLRHLFLRRMLRLCH